MPDMLVKLYELPDSKPLIRELADAGIVIRRGLAPEKHIVLDWVRRNFSAHWESECDVAFSRRPVSCFIATEGERLVGFGCYEATLKNFFGPTGVHPDMRGKGVGKALLLACMQAMYDEGYGYAVIGGAGPTEFYAKTIGAIPIEGSAPGIYRGMLKQIQE
ncbi:GNAT family N-acetyltransferase [Paenibacillus flagellatus]|uniref:GNAT family N-acetyltransferase n=1 Tax=Paenibacillus flagellatus TaxID=2211139 RepID=A0A2V5KY03_9BACL|nr:GNAT family N-acetyltransferase [Paenibacillus flagellatus]PYI57457.1 GNAT family N-acetyltransferase [Paenibacillus flagellatus]